MNMAGSCYKDVESKFESLSNPGITPGLERLHLLLPLLGDPQKQFPAVHVVGTNGKGSTCATLTSILKTAGYKTALYTSPHLVSFGERLEITGKQLSPDRWLMAAEKIEAAIAGNTMLQQDRPTYFELITAAAFLIAAEEKPDIAIMEAGLGGRFDATNTLENVLLTLITPIGIEHTNFLGGTLPQIATEKFAVMRHSAWAVFAGGEAAIEEQFRRTALKNGTNAFLRQELCVISNKNISLHGTNFSLTLKKTGEDLLLHTPLIGLFQPDNAALAVGGACLLFAKYPKIDHRAIRSGISKTNWQGRIEKVANGPVLILDGAHNPHAMAKLTETLSVLYAPDTLNVVLGVMRDKDIIEILQLLKPLVPRLFCTEVPETPRSQTAEALADTARQQGFQIAGVFQNPIDAIRTSRNERRDTVCCGSLYLVGWVKEHFNV